MRALLVSGLLVVLASVPSAESAHGDTSITYYLHAVGECSGQGPELSMDQEDSSGDADGCGAVGAPSEGFGLAYPGKVSLGADVVSGSRAEMHVFVSTAQPDTFRVQATFSAGRASCAGQSEEKQVTSTPVRVEYADFVINCNFKNAAAANVTPSLALVIGSKVNYFIGYEGSHASYMDLLGLRHAEPTNMTNATTPAADGGSPGPGPLLTGLVLLAAAAWTVRRRR